MTTVAAQNAGDKDNLHLDAAALSFDGQTNLFHATSPRITQGEFTIEAEEAVATSTDFEARSEWRFTGRVRIKVDTTSMEADSAVFLFENEQLSRGELTGSPAIFTDSKNDAEHAVSGTAGKLSYDYLDRTLRLMDNAWVRRDRTEMTGCDLIYDFEADRFRSGSADCGEAFSFRVLPKAEDAAPPVPPPE